MNYLVDLGASTACSPVILVRVLLSDVGGRVRRLAITAVDSV
jgi:hypothetical protein